MNKRLAITRRCLGNVTCLYYSLWMVVRSFVAVLIVLGTFASVSARADWAVVGAQTACDSEAGRFEVLPWDRTSDGNMPIESGFAAAADGWSLIRCSLGKRQLVTGIDVIPPQAEGCMGIGAVTIRTLSVDGVELNGGRPIAFGAGCETRTVGLPIIDMRVESVGGKISLTYCSADYNPFVRLPDSPSCETRSIDIPAAAEP
jgi:hypothetical protein